MNTNDDDFIKERLLLLLGFGTSLVLELRKYAPKDLEEDILWFIQAMEDVVYQNKRLPPFPEREMNDFTKEELQDLHDSLYGGMHDDHPVPDHLIILQDKIQSMIDNYCEHENSCKHDWVVGFGSIYSPVVYCKICNCQKPYLPNDIFNKVMGINK